MSLTPTNEVSMATAMAMAMQSLREGSGDVHAAWCIFFVGVQKMMHAQWCEPPAKQIGLRGVWEGLTRGQGVNLAIWDACASILCWLLRQLLMSRWWKMRPGVDFLMRCKGFVSFCSMQLHVQYMPTCNCITKAGTQRCKHHGISTPPSISHAEYWPPHQYCTDVLRGEIGNLGDRGRALFLVCCSPLFLFFTSLSFFFVFFAYVELREVFLILWQEILQYECTQILSMFIIWMLRRSD